MVRDNGTDYRQHPLEVSRSLLNMSSSLMHCCNLFLSHTIDCIRITEEHTSQFFGNDLFAWRICTLTYLDLLCFWQEITSLPHTKQKLNRHASLFFVGHVVAIALVSQKEGLLIGDQSARLFRGDLFFHKESNYNW